MKIYRSKAQKIRRQTYRRIHDVCTKIYKEIQSKSKRRPYVRSKFFRNEKVFLELFWVHLRQKNKKERTRRLRYFEPALDLLMHSVCTPVIKENPNKNSEILYRFHGISQDGEEFFVQVKEDKKKKQKYFMSVFPK